VRELVPYSKAGSRLGEESKSPEPASSALVLADVKDSGVEGDPHDLDRFVRAQAGDYEGPSLKSGKAGNGLLVLVALFAGLDGNGQVIPFRR
jgi:hypothetical protein